MHPALVCWDVTKPPTMDNIVLLTDKEAAKHAKIASISGITCIGTIERKYYGPLLGRISHAI